MVNSLIKLLQGKFNCTYFHFNDAQIPINCSASTIGSVIFVGSIHCKACQH